MEKHAEKKPKKSEVLEKYTKTLSLLQTLRSKQQAIIKQRQALRRAEGTSDATHAEMETLGQQESSLRSDLVNIKMGVRNWPSGEVLVMTPPSAETTIGQVAGYFRGLDIAEEHAELQVGGLRVFLFATDQNERYAARKGIALEKGVVAVSNGVCFGV